MPLIEEIVGLPDNPPREITLTQDKFDRGVISLIDQSKLPKNALKEATNIFLAEDGAPEIRPGLDWYGTAPSAFAIDGADFFVKSDDTIHLLVIANGVVYVSTNDGLTWATCTGGTFTSGKKVHFVQANEFMYMFDGYDNIIRYNGTTTLQTYTALASPSGVSLTKTGLAGTTYTYRYRVSAVNDIGYTQASTAMTIQTDRTRDTFDASNKTTFTWAAVTGAVRYDIYVGQIAGEEVYLDSVEGNGTVTYVDAGQSVEQITSVAPDTNTTQGPRVGDMELIGTRLYATRDRDFPYRVWISGAGRYIGYFSSAYDATYIDLQKGGQFKPMKVEDYRDGKGTPLATVWCDSADGRGCVWQGTLESFTVGDTTFPVPSFYKLPGSRGTPAPDSVVNVLNDYMYYNSQAFYNLGSRAQFLNLLSTDESSANIRPDVKNITQSAADGIASHFQDAKVFFSVPYQSTVNNATIIFDTERKAWLPRAFDVGFERFVAYTDVDGDKHLLCWKPGDVRLTEISEDFRGDYGQPFETSLQTGLRHVNERDRFQFIWAEKAQVEFAQPRGQLVIEVSGITRDTGFRLLGEPMVIAPSTVKNSWTTHTWGDHIWTDTDADAVSYSEPSMKRFWAINESLNAYQYRVQTSTLQAQYVLMIDFNAKMKLKQNARHNTKQGETKIWQI
jgi:hypothetical protein